MTMPTLAYPPQNPQQFFRVEVACMHESHRVSWWVALINVRTRPVDAHVFDDTGRIFPFMSEIRPHAVQEAHEWATFLGVTYDGTVLGETEDDKLEAGYCFNVAGVMQYESAYTDSGTLWGHTSEESYNKDKRTGYPARRVLILP
jgi:hypothetical protein